MFKFSGVELCLDKSRVCQLQLTIIKNILLLSFYYRNPDINDLHQIACIQRVCGSSEGIISDTVLVEPATDELTKLKCQEAGHYLEGGKFDPVTEVEAVCSNDRPGKLPVWKINDVSLQDSADIVCKNGASCPDPPSSFGNTLLISDFDGEEHGNGTTFKLVCPTNNSGIMVNYF